MVAKMARVLLLWPMIGILIKFRVLIKPSCVTQTSLSKAGARCILTFLSIVLMALTSAGFDPLSSPTFRSSTVSPDRKSTCLNSSHQIISYAVFCLKKKKNTTYLKTIDNIPTHLKEQFQFFFIHYKVLEKCKWVNVGGWQGVEAAHREILDGIENFR